MAVYVDNARIPYGRMIMCHLVADTREELMEMARRIELPTKWLQHAGTYKEHFDVCLLKRAKAVWYGAHEISARELAEFLQKKRAPAQASP